MNNAAQTTPGFSSRVTFTFAYDKNGKKVAYYFAGPCVGMLRRIRTNLVAAEQAVALGLADVV